jgi:hypothetical protein
LQPHLGLKTSDQGLALEFWLLVRTRPCRAGFRSPGDAVIERCTHH